MKSGSPRCRRCSARAAANGNWKGGKVSHKKGYVQVWAPDHPRVVNLARKYVFEHILVMERVLGRFLLPGENVHHKNGVKGDNRPENLELWIKPQPAGVRVEDAIAWAREILQRYAGYDQTFDINRSPAPAAPQS